MLNRKTFIEPYIHTIDRREDDNETDTSYIIRNFIRCGLIGCDVI